MPKEIFEGKLFIYNVQYIFRHNLINLETKILRHESNVLDLLENIYISYRERIY